MDARNHSRCILTIQALGISWYPLAGAEMMEIHRWAVRSEHYRILQYSRRNAGTCETVGGCSLFVTLLCSSEIWNCRYG